MNHEAIVVGAGPNGLAAGIVLARAGVPVTVCEAAERIGGGMRTEALTLPGFAHDVCSTIHPMGMVSPFFRSLPLREHGVEWIHPPVLAAHPWDDGTATVLLRSADDTAEGLGTDGPAYRALVAPFVDRWGDIVDDVLAPPLHIPRHPLLMTRFGLRGLRSAMSMAGARFRTPRARGLFVGIAGHALLRMDKAPSGAFGLVLLLAGHVAGWPLARGGSQALANALAAILEEAGGTVATNHRLDRLGDLPRGTTALLDVTPRQLLALAGDATPGWYRRLLERYRYGPGVFKVDWALSEPIPWRAPECRDAGTVHLGGGAEAIARSASLAWHGRPDDDPYVILTQPTLFDPSRAPAGQHVAWAYCHVPHGDTADYTTRIERQVERYAPGFADVVLARSTMHTGQLEARNPNLVGGDINGGIQDIWQLLFRPVPIANPYRTPIPNVFLCSASTPPGGAVHGMCGFHAARAALERIGTRHSAAGSRREGPQPPITGGT